VTPTWAVVLVGLGSAVLGSLLATLLTITHERSAEFRSRMLNAADEFSTGAIEALQQAQVTAGEVMKDSATPLVDGEGLRPEIQEQLDKVNAAFDDLLAKQARIHLLFGDHSPAGVAAAGVCSQLRNMGMALDALPHVALDALPDSLRDSAQLGRYQRNFHGTLEQHERFNRLARAELRQTWFGRLRFWLTKRAPS
jgi:hypothetical protein